MNTFLQKTAIICTTALTLSVLSLPVLAGQLWKGTGRIIRGNGQGGTVELQLEVDGNTVTFLSGPSQHEQVLIENSSSLNGSINTDVGIWQFVQSGRELGVTLHQEQPDRVIRYRLLPQ